MKLVDTHYDNAATNCCARLTASEWDKKEFVWHDKPFLKDHIRTFLYIPLNFGPVISRDHAAIEQAAAYPEQPFWLTDCVSSWGSNLYVAVDRDVPRANIARLSGTFLTRLFEGPYRHIARWRQEMHTYVRDQGREIEKTYFFYATCPKCAKQLGANQVVLFEKLAPESGGATRGRR